MREFVVGAGEAGERVDKLVGAHLHASRAAVRRLIERGAVHVGGRRARKGQRLAAGQRVVVSETVPPPEALRPLPEPDAPLSVIAVDPDWVAIAKPAGPPSHPLAPAERGTVANALVARFPECADASTDPREGGLVHRLDGGTSGVLLAARSRPAWLGLREAFRSGQVEKHYLALVAGAPASEHGVIAAPLESRGRRAVVDAGGRPARTEWRVIERLAGGLTLLALSTRTGRMHQVRAHLAYAELPIVGDRLYGGPPGESGLCGHFLHAARIVLPGGRELLAPLPPDRQTLLHRLGARSSIP
ncbi:MAG TPA: RluA family pseudouridine synthase [Polyangia bacterium]|nr:RluA family pseudouridine synthase [Polyangia bacterium]